MAPKKNKFDDAPKSKTARASAGKKVTEAFKADADIARIVPLCGGEWAYVLNPINGLTHHVRVGSLHWDTLMQTLTQTDHAARIQKELDKLGMTFALPVTAEA